MYNHESAGYLCHYPLSHCLTPCGPALVRERVWGNVCGHVFISIPTRSADTTSQDESRVSLTFYLSYVTGLSCQ